MVVSLSKRIGILWPRCFETRKATAHSGSTTGTGNPYESDGSLFIVVALGRRHFWFLVVDAMLAEGPCKVIDWFFLTLLFVPLFVRCDHFIRRSPFVLWIVIRVRFRLVASAAPRFLFLVFLFVTEDLVQRRHVIPGRRVCPQVMSTRFPRWFQITASLVRFQGLADGLRVQFTDRVQSTPECIHCTASCRRTFGRIRLSSTPTSGH